MAVRIKDLNNALSNLMEAICDFKALDDDGVIEDPMLDRLVEVYGLPDEDYVDLED